MQQFYKDHFTILNKRAAYLMHLQSLMHQFVLNKPNTTLKFDFQFKEAKMQNQEYLLLLAFLSFKNSVCYLKIKIILSKKRFTEFRWNLIKQILSTFSYFPFFLLNLPLYKILFYTCKFNLYINHSVYYIFIVGNNWKIRNQK